MKDQRRTRNHPGKIRVSIPGSGEARRKRRVQRNIDGILRL